MTAFGRFLPVVIVIGSSRPEAASCLIVEFILRTGSYSAISVVIRLTLMICPLQIISK